MATKTLIKFKDAGFRQILKSPGVRSTIESTAARIRAKAGPNFGYTVRWGGYGGGRWIAYVRATSYAGNIEEAVNKTLTRAVG